MTSLGRNGYKLIVTASLDYIVVTPTETFELSKEAVERIGFVEALKLSELLPWFECTNANGRVVSSSQNPPLKK